MEHYSAKKSHPLAATWMDCEVTQSCPTLCNPMDCNLPGSSVHGIFQARILEWVVISFSKESSQPRDYTWSHTLQADSLPSEAPEIIILNQVSQTEKGKYHMISLTCGLWKKKKDTCELISKTETNSQIWRTYGYQRGKRGEERDKLGVWD